MMSDDISDILKRWEYDPENTIRIIRADNGREVLQVRQPLGVEQYELEGRPDGTKPMSKDTFLQVLEEKLSKHIIKNANDKDFAISHEDFMLLQNEGILYYYRYLQLFQLGDFSRTVQDTDHNLQICELSEKYCELEEDKNSILQYEPYIRRINAISKAMLDIKNNKKDTAKSILENAIQEIDDLKEIDTPAFKFEKIRSLSYLKSALSQIEEDSLSPSEELQSQLDKAVADEDYERAAWLRDQINRMNDSDKT